MKILCTSDLHLGKAIYSVSLLEEQESFIYDILLPTIEREQPDALIIAGDIFDRSIAPVAAINLFDRLIAELCARRLPLLAITGNHDGAQRMTLGADLLKLSGIHLATSLENALEPVLITAADGERAAISLVPHFDSPHAREFLKAHTSLEDIDQLDLPGLSKEIFALAQQKCAATGAGTTIAVAHLTMFGALRCESESAVSVGCSEEVGSECLAPFSFGVLGHIHSPQKAGENVRYCGSPLRYSFDKNERDKSLLMLEISGSKVSHRLIDITPRRQMRVLRGLLDDIIAQAHAAPNSRDDFIFAELEDETRFHEPLARLREVYPNTLGLRYVATSTQVRTAEREQLRQSLRGGSLSDIEILRSLVAEVAQTQPSEAEEALFLELLGEEDEA